MLWEGVLRLDAARDEKGADHVALVRIEQLYPLPEAQLKEILSSYPREANVVWCQEEPMNQGAWYSIQDSLRRLVSLSMFGAELRYIGRPASHRYQRVTPRFTSKSKMHLFQRPWVRGRLTKGKTDDYHENRN